VTRGLISNSQETVVKAPFVLIEQPAKPGLFLVSPNLPCGCQAQDFGIRIAKQNKQKVNNRKVN
jgi:hypothetical protein